MGIPHHLQKIGVEVRFALEIENEIEQLPVNVVDRLLKEVFLQHTGWTGKLTQTTGTFRAAQIATGSGLKGNRNRIAPLNGLLQHTAQVIAAPHFHRIPQLPYSTLSDQIQCIIPMQTPHRRKDNP